MWLNTYLVFLSDEGVRRAYVDGTEVLSAGLGASARDLLGLRKTAIGAMDLPGCGRWGTELTLDDFMIWDYALKPGEVHALYSGKR